MVRIHDTGFCGGRFAGVSLRRNPREISLKRHVQTTATLAYWRFLVGALGVVGASSAALHSPYSSTHPDATSFAVALAISAGVPLLYWILLTRPGVTTRRSMPRVIVLALLGARLILPAAHRSFLGGARYVAAPFELLLIGYLIVEVRRALWARPTQDGIHNIVDVPEVIEKPVARALGEHGLTRSLASEVSMLYYAFGGGGPVPPAASDHAFAIDAREGLSLTLAIVGVIAVEAAVTAILLWHRPLGAGALGALSVYSVVWLMGDYRARRRRLITIGDGQLVIRVGLQCTATSPLSNVQAVHVVA